MNDINLSSPNGVLASVPVNVTESIAVCRSLPTVKKSLIVHDEPPGGNAGSTGKNDMTIKFAHAYVDDAERSNKRTNTGEEESQGDADVMVSCSTAAPVEAVANSSANAAEITTSHAEDDAKPTPIDTVTLKCDLNDYLINLINVRCSLAQSEAAGARARAGEIKYPSVSLRSTYVAGISSSTSSYVSFDELVRCTMREREWARTGLPSRLRLCGGGEDSINNGTSAWGTPPGVASNGTASAWGILPNQQQSLPLPAWGTVGDNSNTNNNNNVNNNSNNGSSGSNSINQAPSNAASNGNNGNHSTGNGGLRGGSGSAVDPNFNKTNAQSQPPAQQAAQSNAWNASAANQRVGQQPANVTSNNGNPQHHHQHHNQNHHQQQQQQQQPPNGQNQGANNNNDGVGNGTAKNQLEVLSTMREALFSQDGWGCQHVNQDTNWEVPGSPEPQGACAAASSASGGGGTAAAAGAKADGGGGAGAGGAPNGGGGWKPQCMNNGTELWESNLRNGSGPNHQQSLQQAKPVAPWVPANNLGGTWLEDDDNGSGGGGAGGGGGGGSVGGPPGGSDGANVWNGSAASIVAGTVPPSLGPSVAPVSSSGWAAGATNSVIAGGVSMWPPGANMVPGAGMAGGTQNTAPMNNPQMTVKKDLNEWASGGGQQGSAGGIVGLPPGTPGGAQGLMAQGWTDGRVGVTTPGGVAGLNMGGSIGQSSSLIGGGAGDLRGDPRGVSGRLNGAMGWGGGTDHVGVKLQPPGGLLPSTGGASAAHQWGASNNGVAIPGAQNKPPSAGGGGWDDGGRPVPALDDGAAGGMLWGQSNAMAGGVLSRQSSTGWKDVPESMMRAGGGPAHLQRNQAQAALQGGVPFGSIPVPSGPNTAAGVRFGGVGGGNGGSLVLGKPDAMWGQSNPAMGRIGSWEDGPGWGDDKVGTGWNVDLGQNGGGWNKTPTTPKSGGGNWPDPNDLTTGAGPAGMDWCLAGGKPAANSKPLANQLELIRASKEYRLLCEMGHKKEDVEFSLRATGMIFDEAMELLRHGAAVGLPTGGGGGWRRPLSDEHAGLGMGFDGPYSGRIPPLNHTPSGLSFSQNNQAMVNNIPGGPGGLGLEGGGGPANLVALNNLKYLSQQGSGGAAHPSFSHSSLLLPGAGGGSGRGPNQQSQQAPQQAHQQQQLAAAAAAQPSNQQLRMLVQQIQLAVQNGFLNHQILNQPLAPQTLILLNQLLNHIKQMQLTQTNLARSGATGGVSAVQLTLAINKHKTQIAQLQQQIVAQQSIYLKQQQPGGGAVVGGGGGNSGGLPGHQGSLGPPPLMPSNAGIGLDFLRQQQQQQDLMALQGNFGDMGLSKDPIITSTGGVFPPPVIPPQHATGGSHIGGGNAVGNVVVSGSTSQQSRLNQWKLPSLEKDPSAGKDDLTDFSRAPGPTAAKCSTTSSNLSSLGLVQDGTWATGRTNLTDGWPEQTGEPDSKDWTNTANNASSQDSSAFTDLVPEFEPGKPWKGTQLKIEDDPSITPGSVARSPLSISTAKESELFAGITGSEKVSPSAAGDGSGAGLNLSSSAWSFNTPSSTSVASEGKPGNISTGKSSVWPDSSAGGGVVVSSSAADVWCTPIGKPSATRGPPPGLGGTANKGGNGGAAPSGGWSAGGMTSAQRAVWGGATSWLLLKNLTSQIDASTLRTLCMQHGPILSFHSYPDHGMALCRYTTREQATKAQQALNNCPLGTGTISAECPASESEVQTYLQQLGTSVTVSAGAANVAVSSSSAGSISSISSQSWRPRGSNSDGTDTWGSGWPIAGSVGASAGSGTTAANLWAPLDSADRGTPSSLNSFLPESLLGPELN